MLARPFCREDQNPATKTKLSVLVKPKCQDFTMTKIPRNVRPSLMEVVVATIITTRVCLNASKVVDIKVN